MKFKHINWAPYLLILPAFAYLMAFFGWPMLRSLQLAFQRDSPILFLRESMEKESKITGQVEKGTFVTIVDSVEELESEVEGGLLAEKHYWLKVAAVDVDGKEVEGWAERGDVFVKDAAVSSRGTVDGPLSVWTEPDESSEVQVVELAQNRFDILRVSDLESAWGKITTGIRAPSAGWVKQGPVHVADAIRSEEGVTRQVPVSVRQEPKEDSETVAVLAEGTAFTIIQWQDVDPDVDPTMQWLKIAAEDSNHNPVEGWVQQSGVSVADATMSVIGRVITGDVPLRAGLSEDSEVLAELNNGDFALLVNAECTLHEVMNGQLRDWNCWLKIAPVVGWIPRDAMAFTDPEQPNEAEVREGGTSVQTRAHTQETSRFIVELARGTSVTFISWQEPEEATRNSESTPRWFEISGQDNDGNAVEGWVRREDVTIRDTKVSTQGRVEEGEDVKEWTLDSIERMVNDRNFDDALKTTILLLVLILPVQFTLAIIMALVLQSRLRGNTIFLYIYSIPLGVSDLAAGLAFVSIFTQNGFLNTVLEKLGVIDKAYIFLDPMNRKYIILAIVLAEAWRATSIVMVIVVSGLQAIPTELLEAGELFGASLWQRLRHIIFPLLKPSLQVALILRTILAFQVFAVVIAIAGNVPEVITVLSNETYRWYSVGEYNNPNVAAAYAGFIMLISMVVSVFYLRVVRTQQEVEMEG